MNRLIYADSQVSADLYYATRFLAPDPFLYFTSGGRSFAVLNDLEVDRADREAKVDRVLRYSKYREELEKKLRRRPDFDETILYILKKHGVKRAIIPADFPFKPAVYLVESGIKLSVPKGKFFPERINKTPAEVRQIEKALRVTEKLLSRARDILRNSRVGRQKKLKWGGSFLTSERLRTEIQIAALQMGAVADRPIIAGGAQACDPHQCGYGPLKSNELIVVDIFPRLIETRYWGDMTRTFLKGRATVAQKKLFETVCTAQKVALGVIRAGMPAENVHRRVTDFFEKQGYKTGEVKGRRQGFFHGTGHGLGLEIHEAPRMSFGSSDRLTKASVVTVEPGLYYPAVGGVRIEDVVLVTSRHCNMLSHFPVVLEV